MAIISANTKLIVDRDFWSKRDWIFGEPIQLRLGFFKNDRDYNRARELRTEGVTRLEIIYRAPSAPSDTQWTTVWSCVIGNFILPASDTYYEAVYISLYG